MKMIHTAFGLGSVLAVAVATAATPTIATARTVDKTYVACNTYGDCWRVHHLYAYGKDVPIRYYNSDWYTAHQADTNIHWLADPVEDRGYYVEGGTWHDDPGARALKGGGIGAALGAAVGCLVTLPAGCLPGAAAGAAVGGGTGVVAGAASTPH